MHATDRKSDRTCRPVLLLLVALSLPFASPALAETVQAKTLCEHCLHCASDSTLDRCRRECRAQQSFAEVGFTTARRAVRLRGQLYVGAGHRLSNGLLAPLRC